MSVTSGIIISTILILTLAASVGTILPLISQQSSELVVDDETYTAQKTAISNAGKLPIHQTHQVVTVLPPRTDGKIWVGTVTWASSKPIEVEMWHFYNSSITGVDAAHGKPVLTPYGNNKTIAFTSHSHYSFGHCNSLCGKITSCIIIRTFIANGISCSTI